MHVAVQEIMPLVQQRYGASSDPSRNAFGGGSFGGVAALYSAMHFPHVFGWCDQRADLKPTYSGKLAAYKTKSTSSSSSKSCGSPWLQASAVASCSVPAWAPALRSVLAESPSLWAAEGRFLGDIAAYRGPLPERIFLAVGTKE